MKTKITALEIIKKIIKETALITVKKILILLEITVEAILIVILTVIEVAVNKNYSQKNTIINWCFFIYEDDILYNHFLIFHLTHEYKFE